MDARADQGDADVTDTDHQINALMQMLSEANGREMQLRSVLGKMQGEITRLEAEVVGKNEEIRKLMAVEDLVPRPADRLRKSEKE